MSSEIRDRIEAAWAGLDPAAVSRVVSFYQLLRDENEIQNLTRLISPQEFVEGHLLDVKALADWGKVDFPAMDLGSGGGVPGLLAAAVGLGEWVLAESEGRKAEFLGRAAEKLGLESRIRVFSGRGEAFLKDERVASIVSRAVGKVEKIYSWVEKCSTWNNLVLLKGPGWEEEWRSFGQTRVRNHLKIEETFHYEVGQEARRRLIVKLSRVPRGTFDASTESSRKKPPNRVKK